MQGLRIGIPILIIIVNCDSKCKLLSLSYPLTNEGKSSEQNRHKFTSPNQRLDLVRLKQTSNFQSPINKRILMTQESLINQPKPRGEESTLTSFQAFCQILGRHKWEAW